MLSEKLNNPKFIVLLLVLVVATWGSFFYKVYDYTTGEDVEMTANPITTAIVTTNAALGFSAPQLDYPDPFFKTTKQKKKIVRPVATSLEKKEKTKKGVRWPQVKYKGLIKSAKKISGIVEINGRSHIAFEKDSIEQIIIHRLWQDSIEVAYQEEVKVIQK